VDVAIARRDFDAMISIGKDPTHVQPADDWLLKLKDGWRPGPSEPFPSSGSGSRAAGPAPASFSWSDPSVSDPAPWLTPGLVDAPPGAPAVPSAAAPSLSDAVLATFAIPPFPTPEQIGDYQLTLWMRRLREELVAGGGLNTLSQELRDYLRYHFPAYLADATRQRILTAAAEVGIHDVAGAWGHWQRRWGDPMAEAVRQLTWWIREVRR
jgi:hypothetical protein